MTPDSRPKYAPFPAPSERDALVDDIATAVDAALSSMPARVQALAVIGRFRSTTSEPLGRDNPGRFEVQAVRVSAEMFVPPSPAASCAPLSGYSAGERHAFSLGKTCGGLEAKAARSVEERRVRAEVAERLDGILGVAVQQPDLERSLRKVEARVTSDRKFIGVVLHLLGPLQKGDESPEEVLGRILREHATHPDASAAPRVAQPMSIPPMEAKMAAAVKAMEYAHASDCLKPAGGRMVGLSDLPATGGLTPCPTPGCVLQQHKGDHQDRDGLKFNVGVVAERVPPAPCRKTPGCRYVDGHSAECQQEATGQPDSARCSASREGHRCVRPWGHNGRCQLAVAVQPDLGDVAERAADRAARDEACEHPEIRPQGDGVRCTHCWMNWVHPAVLASKSSPVVT
jgi:hypothetical protein